MEKAEFLNLISQHWDDIRKLQNSESLYDLEKDFDQIWVDLGRDVLEKTIGKAPSELSIVSETSARPSGARPLVPAKMTSSILPPRSDFAPCSPITQARASTTLDFPEPFGPTTAVTPFSKAKVVGWAKD